MKGCKGLLRGQCAWYLYFQDKQSTHVSNPFLFLNFGLIIRISVLKPPPRNFFIRRTNSSSLSWSSPLSPSPFPFRAYRGRGRRWRSIVPTSISISISAVSSIRSSSITARLAITPTVFFGNATLIIWYGTTRHWVEISAPSLRISIVWWPGSSRSWLAESDLNVTISWDPTIY